LLSLSSLTYNVRRIVVSWRYWTNRAIHIIKWWKF